MDKRQISTTRKATTSEGADARGWRRKESYWPKEWRKIRKKDGYSENKTLPCSVEYSDWSSHQPERSYHQGTVGNQDLDRCSVRTTTHRKWNSNCSRPNNQRDVNAVARVCFIMNSRSTKSVLAFLTISNHLAMLTINSTIKMHVLSVYAPTKTSQCGRCEDPTVALTTILSVPNCSFDYNGKGIKWHHQWSRTGCGSMTLWSGTNSNWPLPTSFLASLDDARRRNANRHDHCVMFHATLPACPTPNPIMDIGWVPEPG